MKAAICIQGTRAATYSDAMAAIAAEFPYVTEYELIFLPGSDEGLLFPEIEHDLASVMFKNEWYSKANRSGRNSLSVSQINKNTFKNTNVIDVTGISKENTAEIMAIAITSGKSVCTLSWENQDKNRKYVGEDNYKYFNTMNTPLINKIFKIQRAVWLMFYTLSLVIIAFIATYSASILGYHIIPDKLINLLGVLLGIGGLFLSYVALSFVPNQSEKF